jgi:class 3 adenylate cyclase
VEFASVVDAVRCAVAVQQAMLEAGSAKIGSRATPAYHAMAP